MSRNFENARLINSDDILISIKYQRTPKAGQILLQPMKNSHISQRISERIAQRMNSKMETSFEEIRTLNEDLLKMISQIRLLEDQLMTEQYKTEFLQKENQQYMKMIDQLEIKIDHHERQLAEVNQEVAIARMKRNQIEKCQQTLVIIYEEMKLLNKSCNAKKKQNQELIFENSQIQTEIHELKRSNELEQSLHRQVNEIIYSMLVSNEIDFADDKPITSLQDYIIHLNEEIQKKKQECERSKRDFAAEISLQKQKFIKLEFGYKLQNERIDDQSKQQTLEQICYDEESIEKMIEDMLRKEDELIDKITKKQQQIDQEEEYLENQMNELHRIEQEKERNNLMKIAELKDQRTKISQEIQNYKSKIETYERSYRQIRENTEIQSKIDFNFTAMKRLRDAQQKNKQLKYKMQELQKYQELLLQQKQMLHTNS